ncbi:MAG: VPS10 domain-containing protein [Candidatus Aminicenantales bacterium]
MKFQRILAGFLLLTITALGTASGQAAPAPGVDASFVRWRNIGPGNMAGRVSDVAVLDSDFRIVLAAAASGGVFKSTNAGITWTPIFDKYGSGWIGDVAFFQKNPDIIWVGTGEANNRNPSGWGDGIYKSTDGGKTFANVGLNNTYQIARIVTHPTDPDTVYVAAIGNLWAYTGDRGIFKTTDGGKTWQKLLGGLPNDPKVGCTELAMDPQDPNTLYLVMYHRIRNGWSIYSGGPVGGIYKSVDAGATWRKLTKGLPTGDTGRIGLDIYRKNPKTIVACVEADQKLPQDMSVPGPGVYRSDDAGETWKYLFRYQTASRPFYHSQIRIHPQDDNLIYVLYRNFYISRDGGKTFGGGFEGQGGVYGDPHAMWIDPIGGKTMYFGDDGGIHISHDAGKSWIKFDNMAIGQYYGVAVDMRKPYWVYGGLQDNNTWGTPSNSRDEDGILNDSSFFVSGGDGFHAQVDPSDWRTVYSTGHGGVLGRSNVETREHKGITPTSETTVNIKEFAKTTGYKPFTFITGGNSTDRTLWSDVPDRSVNGFYLPPNFRFNWDVPVALSPINPGTVYYGSNHLFKSVDRGDTWMVISPDLTTDDPVKRDAWATSGGLTLDISSAECYCTIVTIGPSPITDLTVWAGTDDGNVQVTRNGGAKWTNVRPNVTGVPANTWVSCVEPSHFAEGRAYATFDNHRSGDFKPYVFRTEDFGKTWKNITSNLPDGQSVNVIREDFKNPDLLFAGTEIAVYVSLDGGANWSRFTNNLPTVPVYDLVLHPREADLVAGTHGRSIWIADDITALQQWTPEVAAKDVHLFQSRPAVQWLNVSRGGSRGAFYFRGENPPAGTAIHFYVKTAPREDASLTISNIDGSLKRTAKIKATAGINRWQWDMRYDAPPAPADANPRRRRRPVLGPMAESGVYRVTLAVGGQTIESTVTICEDPLKAK